MDLLIQWDYWLFEILNGQLHASFFDTIIPFWRNKYFWIPMYLFVILFFIYNYPKKAIYLIGFTILAVFLADQISSGFFKPYFNRLRPCHQGEIITSLRNLVPCGSGKSFTSSHATTHFAIAITWITMFFHRFPRITPLLLFWAATISYGQIYVGVHFPLDVVVGAMVGTLIGWTCGYWAVRFGDLRSAI